jgi:serpin B
MLRTLLFGALTIAPALAADSTVPAAQAINTLGLDLLKRQPATTNVVLSPWSIQVAMAMAYDGSEGDTRTEMAKALQYSNANTSTSLAALQRQIDREIQNILDGAGYGEKEDKPIRLDVANRLFSKPGFQFEKSYFDLLRERYGVSLDTIDFARNPERAAATINSWVEKQTQERIRDIISADAFNDQTSLVIVNAIYLKAAWFKTFEESATRQLPFMLTAAKSVKVPTMLNEQDIGYEKRKGYAAISLPYLCNNLQFLVLLPDEAGGLPALEDALDEKTLAACARLPSKLAHVFLPKFKMEPPALTLGSAFRALGMKRAFEPGRADFTRITSSPLCISDVLHKAFLLVDENGTEAAGATTITMFGASKPAEPIEVRINRPFLLAIQHIPSGACLFLGRVTDPR